MSDCLSCSMKTRLLKEITIHSDRQKRGLRIAVEALEKIKEGPCCHGCECHACNAKEALEKIKDEK